MGKLYEFDAEIIKQDGIDAVFVEFPYDVQTEFGTKGQVKVKATFEGVEYRGSLARMGHSCHILGITRKIRSGIGKQPGDSVHVTLERDETPRAVELPPDFREELEKNKEAESIFKSQSYTRQKEYVLWIEGAKRAETREKRIHEALRRLLEKNIPDGAGHAGVK